MRFPLGVALAIGLFQCLAIVPGVSRSGATIAGALLMRCDKRAAAEFSFFLAIPTMLGAFVLDFYENRGVLSGGDIGIIADRLRRLVRGGAHRRAHASSTSWRATASRPSPGGGSCVGTVGLVAIWAFG